MNDTSVRDAALGFVIIFLALTVTCSGFRERVFGCGASESEVSNEIDSPSTLNAAMMERPPAPPPEPLVSEDVSPTPVPAVEAPKARVPLSPGGTLLADQAVELLEAGMPNSAQLVANQITGADTEHNRVGAIGREILRAFERPIAQARPQVGDPELRLRLLDEGLAETKEISKSKAKCETALVLFAAFEKLRLATKADKARYARAKSAVRVLDRCRERGTKQVIKWLHEEAKKLRVAYAKAIDQGFLEEGQDVAVTTRGTAATELRLTSVYFNRVAAHQLVRSSPLLNDAREKGFVRVTFYDGYYASHYYDLKPLDIKGAERDALQAVQLDQRFELAE